MRSIAAIFLLLFAANMYAQTVIHTPQDTAVTLNIVGQSLLITESGAITATGVDDAVTMNADNQLLTNRGVLISIEEEGIDLNGNNARVINYGSIYGEDSGIQSNGQNATIINYGFIRAGGEGVDFGVNPGSKAFNYGTISGSQAVEVSTIKAHLTNYGTILGISYDFPGNDRAIFLQSSGQLVLTNFGTIAVAHPDNPTNFAILVNKNDADDASQLTLLLNRGSKIIGQVDSASPLNLSVENGLNLRLTMLDSNDQGFGILNVVDPHITIGNTHTIATVDPSSFVMQSDILEDLSDSILNIAYQPEDNFVPRCSSRLFAQRPFDVSVSMIGSMRKRKRSIETKNSQAGVIVSANFELGDRKGQAAGNQRSFRSAVLPYMGGSWGTGSVKNKTATANTQAYFGGISYEQFCFNTFMGISVAAGGLQSKNKRIVMFNLAPNGEETARAKPWGALLTSEVYLSKSIANIPTAFFNNTCTINPILSATFRYAGLFFGTYSEKGSSANLQAKNRNISLLKPKGEIAFAATWCNANNRAAFKLAPYFAFAGRFQVAGVAFNSKLMNVPLYFKTGSPKRIGEFIYGVNGNLSLNTLKKINLNTKTPNYFVFFFRVQGLHDTSHSDRLLGEAGFSYNF